MYVGFGEGAREDLGSGNAAKDEGALGADCPSSRTGGEREMEQAEGGQREVAPVQGAGWSAATFLGALVVVAVARLLYLARYGWDLGWMNLLYLERARSIALGRADVATAEEQPLAYFALVAARGLGLDARQANELIYLVAHLLLAAGALGIARFVWPQIAARRRRALVATLAVVPLLASQSGRNNLGVSLAAGLAAGALALAVTAAAAPRARPSTIGAILLGGVAAALASMGRYESLMTCLGGALVLGVVGPRMPGVRQARGPALALGLGALGGLATVIALHRALGAGAPADKTYAFYTFYDGLPLLMYPHPHAGEYDRYAASVGFFGTFADNHGSVLRALVHHPGFALLRILTKPVDHLAVLAWLYGLTPIGLALAAVGARGVARPRDGSSDRSRARTWPRRWVLAAYLFPLGMLFIPQQNQAYYLCVAVPLVLMVARGADRVGARLRPAPARALGAAVMLSALAFVVVAGKAHVSNSRAINAAVPYLEQRCRDGCLTNVLPQALRDQLWVVTDAGARLPSREKRDEQAILHPKIEARVETTTGANIERGARSSEPYDFCARVRRSRAGGFGGPVLYVDARVTTFTVFDPDFDPEVRYEGTVDRAGLVPERRFPSGPDEVVVYNLPAGGACRSMADAGLAAAPTRLGPETR
jgi:hypothetical protein